MVINILKEDIHCKLISINILDKSKKFKSGCNFHDNCVEGFCASTYIARVINCDMKDIKNNEDHEIWNDVVHYLGQLCANIFLLTSVERIVIGGGMSFQHGLIEGVRKEFRKLVNGYIDIEDEIIRKSHLNDKNAMLGSLLLDNY